MRPEKGQKTPYFKRKDGPLQKGGKREEGCAAGGTERVGKSRWRDNRARLVREGGGGGEGGRSTGNP